MTLPIVSSKVFCYPSRAVRGAAGLRDALTRDAPARAALRTRGANVTRTVAVSGLGKRVITKCPAVCDHQTGAGLDVYRIYTCTVARLDNNSRALVVRYG
jgi:hypothetical protein